jgi:phosphoribosylformimino-5-aminoimidazole carboxamide ribonucleotide (ProFAR) isomerase
MEVFYYVEQPDVLIQNIFDFWLNLGGRLIMGIDFYHENTSCHSWQEDCGVNLMQLFPAKNWIEFFKEAGFKNVNSRNIGAADNWNGTLVVIGEK